LWLERKRRMWRVDATSWRVGSRNPGAFITLAAVQCAFHCVMLFSLAVQRHRWRMGRKYMDTPRYDELKSAIEAEFQPLYICIVERVEDSRRPKLSFQVRARNGKILYTEPPFLLDAARDVAFLQATFAKVHRWLCRL